MDVWEKKLQLAESIAEHKFTEIQADVFGEDNRDFAIFFFKRREGQTTVGITYALVNAYWKPNSKYLYISDDGNSNTQSKNMASALVKNFEKCRPERTYQTTDGHVCIGFGETKSEVRFHSLSANQIGQDYDAIILDASYHNIRLKHIMKFISIIAGSGKLVVMSKIDDEYKLPKTQNKLDAIIDDVGISCE